VVVVTEELLVEAAATGDIEKLIFWATRGVRVKSAEPLYKAARGGFPAVVRHLVREMGAGVNQVNKDGWATVITAARYANPAVMQCLVAELGADINQGMQIDGCTPLILAVEGGNLAIVRCLIQLGAKIGAVDVFGNTALLVSALSGRYETMQYLLEDAGADMDDYNNMDDTVWDSLIEYFEEVNDDDEQEDPAALTGLLRVMVLRDAPPPKLVALLSDEDIDIRGYGCRRGFRRTSLTASPTWIHVARASLCYLRCFGT
jgi:ankyrin repeat protein